MKLYHGTRKESLEQILKEGLKANWGFVYMSSDLEFVRKFYGKGVIFEIESDDLEQDLLGTYREMLCDVFNTSDFYHYGDNIPSNLLKVIK
jgi:RNA:NAD 2'-phosphotransferase (TPT1/KptA family)